MAPSTFLPLLVLALAVGLGAAQNATMVFTGDSTLCKLGDMLNNGMPCSGKAWKCECPKWNCQIGDKPECDDLKVVGGAGTTYGHKLTKGTEPDTLTVNTVYKNIPYLSTSSSVDKSFSFNHRIYDGEGHECDHDCEYDCAYSV